MTDELRDERQDRVLELRNEDRSFVAIARIVGYANSKEALAAFHRALRTQPAAEQEATRQGELARLDRVAAQLRGAEGVSAEVVTKRLRVVKQLRAQLLAL